MRLHQRARLLGSLIRVWIEPLCGVPPCGWTTGQIRTDTLTGPSPRRRSCHREVRIGATRWSSRSSCARTSAATPRARSNAARAGSVRATCSVCCAGGVSPWSQRQSHSRVAPHSLRQDGTVRRQRPSSVRPGWSSGRRPSGQWNLRSSALMGLSLMLACRSVIRPFSSNSQFSLPWLRNQFVNADLNLTHFQRSRRSKSDPPGSRSMRCSGA